MPAVQALAIVLAASLAATPAPPADPANVISPLDVPGHNNQVVMAKPDRNGDKVVCRNQPIPDSRFLNRICARRRDLEAASAIHQQQVTQHQHVCDIVGAC
jgi:hypothetical protein